MTNYSLLARREQVLLKLQLADGGWVDGADLANERTGGSEGLKRLRELRAEGHDIRKRHKPNSSQFQYRLVKPLVEETVFDPPLTVKNGDSIGRTETITVSPEGEVLEREVGPWEVTRAAPEPAEVYEYKQPPRIPGKAHLGKTADGKFIMVRDEPPVLPGQTAAFDDVEVVNEKFTSMPTVLELGRTVPCPLCGGYRRQIKERDPVTNKPLKGGKVIGYEELSRNPQKPSETCPRCNGFGVVPR